jgi:nitroimidazol reductase NimA-like FMN-containing flavoprotein (pyridoxamine 5'-phosphate oxidase superfamily)
MHEKIVELIRGQDVCVLATSSENRPHCSLMAYLPSEDCTSFYLVTSRSTKKYANMLRNPRVSLLIDNRPREAHPGERPNAQALTVEGSSRPAPESEKSRLRSALIAAYPTMRKFIEHPDADIVEISAESYLLLDGLTESYYERPPGGSEEKAAAG